MSDDRGDHVNAVVRGSGTSFFWAMRLLPRKKREAMFGIYAFCREVDDIADGPDSVEEKKLQLGQWCGEIERLYGDQPRNLVTQALQRPVEEFGLRKEDFRAVIDGMEMDAGDGIRIKDVDELYLYCDRVACAVGRLSCRVFGLDDDKGVELSYALGQALQLTNILRDIAEDAERDRLYIPGDLLKAHDVTETDLAGIFKNPGFARACDVLAGTAENRFAQAEAIIATCERDKIRPAIMMMEVYRQILVKLTRRGWQNIYLPVGISKLAKLWIALRFGFL
ncbi:MAG: presqualene diphosphate synthase HpnD [Rhodospirillales bacterium]|nr:presqualene diphosphate synthase HpnD [Rhodospirillales bacterium]